MMTAEATTDFVNQTFKRATESFNETIQTGLKFQEQSTQFWTQTAGKNLDQFHNQTERMTKEVFPVAKKNLDQFHTNFDEQAKKSLNVLRQSFETSKDWMAGNACDKTMDLWRASFDAMRSSADMFTKANTEMMSCFTDAACKATAAKGNGKPTPKP